MKQNEYYHGHVWELSVCSQNAYKSPIGAQVHGILGLLFTNVVHHRPVYGSPYIAYVRAK